MDQQATVVAQHVANPLDVKDLKSAVWDDAQPVGIERLWSGQRAPAARHAEVRLCWSDEGLHALFGCEQHEPVIAAHAPSTNKKTIGVWDRDVCEIFVAPDATNPSVYYEFEAAPNGEWVDLGIVNKPTGRETEWDYSSGMTTTSIVGDDFVFTLITIPWSLRIPKPKSGDVWRVNLFRCIGLHPTDRYLAWRPTKTPEPNFHVPDAFGWLRFE
ncbi:MAG TPA: carbohydrate-binding family 9-like protein [Pyrinomonadaceae bacterium]|nr:carbohydrate-binding family 9-like protein [Pyrinomonadaceae bacterium]